MSLFRRLAKLPWRAGHIQQIVDDLKDQADVSPEFGKAD